MKNVVNMSRVWIAALTVCIGSNVVNAQDDPPSKVPLHDYLVHSGKRLGVYFTIERWANTPERISAFETSHRFAVNEEIDSIEKLIGQLKKELPSIEIKQNFTNPKIIHLIEKELNTERDYVMNRRISVRHVGVLGDLLDVVHKEVPNIGHFTWGGIGTPFGAYDKFNWVKVEAMHKSLRDIFTDCVPLEGYCRVLWRAATERRDDGLYTMQIYFGPKDQAAMNKALEEKAKKERADK